MNVLGDFHFIRPAWLLLAPIVDLALVDGTQRRKTRCVAGGRPWNAIC